MADSFLTLTDLAKINNFNLQDRGVTDLLDDAPFFARLAATTATNGNKHSYLKETAAPVVGFRDAYAGRENSKSGDTVVDVLLKILDASWDIDKAVADAFSGNLDTGGGKDAFLARETRRHLKAAFFGAEKQFIYGTKTGGLAATGFTGLADVPLLATTHASAQMVVNAGGAIVGGQTSVWLVRTNGDGTDVMAVLGNEGNIQVSPTTIIQRAPAAGTGTYPAYYTPIDAWLGMQIGSAYSVGRIANIDTAKPLHDDLIYEAISRFPAARQPNLIVMHRRSLEQLRKSRTATNATGVPAPIPSEVNGIPIITTDALTLTEAVLPTTAP